MAIPADYIETLHRRGVRLWVEGGQLCYRASVGSLNAEELARLRTMKDGIVAELSRSPQTLPPLSVQQHWLLDLIKRHERWKRTLGYALRLQGALNPSQLQESLAALLRKHEALRTRMVEVAGTPRQQVDEAGSFQLTVVPVANSSATEIDPSVRRLIDEFAARDVDQALGPMMDALLLQVSEQDHFLVLWVHRLTADCMAVSQLFRDLWLIYRDGIEGVSSPAQSTAMQYGDYALWQQATEDTWQRRHATFWKEYLAGAVRLHWPVDAGVAHDAPALRSLHTSLGDDASAALRELGRQTPSLAAMVMLSVYVAVISRWCDQRDFVLPFNIAGRHSEHEGMVGYFSHVLYLRVKLNGSESFVDLMESVSREFYRAVAHQDFGRIATMRPDLLGGTLCQWLSWHPADVAGLDVFDVTNELGLTVTNIHFQTPEELANVPAAVVDLEITFFESEGTVNSLAIYRADLFTATTLERLMRAVSRSAKGFATDPRGRPALEIAGMSMT